MATIVFLVIFVVFCAVDYWLWIRTVRSLCAAKLEVSRLAAGRVQAEEDRALLVARFLVFMRAMPTPPSMGGVQPACRPQLNALAEAVDRAEDHMRRRDLSPASPAGKAVHDDQDGWRAARHSGASWWVNPRSGRAHVFPAAVDPNHAGEVPSLCGILACEMAPDWIKDGRTVPDNPPPTSSDCEPIACATCLRRVSTRHESTPAAPEARP